MVLATSRKPSDILTPRIMARILIFFAKFGKPAAVLGQDGGHERIPSSLLNSMSGHALFEHAARLAANSAAKFGAVSADQRRERLGTKITCGRLAALALLQEPAQCPPRRARGTPHSLSKA